MNRLFKVGEVLPLHESGEIFRLLINDFVTLSACETSDDNRRWTTASTGHRFFC
jgi:hypothetical protein